MTIHAIERAKEWYKLDLTFDDLREILSIILEGDAKFSHSQGDCSVYRLRYKHKLLIPVVARDSVIVTFLPVKEKRKRGFIDIDGIMKIKRKKRAL